MRLLILAFCVVVFLAGCVTTNTPSMCPSEDAVIGAKVDGKTVPVVIKAGTFDGDYTTVDEFKEAVEARRDAEKEKDETGSD